MAIVELNTIEKKIERLMETKNDIKTAIINKGVTIEDTDTFNSYAEKIDSISTQPNLQTKEVSITTNGTTTITSDEGYDGIEQATVITNVQPNLQAKEVSLTSSAAATYTPDTGYDGLSSVKVTPATETKTYSVTSTSGGTVSATSGKVGMTSVTVTPKLQDKTANCTSTSAVTLTPDSGYCGLKSAKVTPVTETRTHNVSANGTTTVSVNSGKVGMTKVTVNTSVYRAITHTTSYVGKGDMGSKQFTIPTGVTTAKIIVSCQFPSVYSFTPKYSTTSGSVAWSNDNLQSGDNFYHRCTVLTLTKNASNAATVSVWINDDSSVGSAHIHYYSAVAIY